MDTISICMIGKNSKIDIERIGYKVVNHRDNPRSISIFFITENH